ncbi:MAG: hypothetical protein PHE55_19980 [Methylococcaceae bacterium]|nr:hypothetical protein [Methylococcaceae bacterium]
MRSKKKRVSDPVLMAQIAEARKEAKRKILRSMYVKTKDAVARDMIVNEALEIPQVGRRRIIIDGGE